MRTPWQWVKDYRLGYAYWKRRAQELEDGLLGVEIMHSIMDELQELRLVVRTLRLNEATQYFQLREISRAALCPSCRTMVEDITKQTLVGKTTKG